MTDLHYLTPLEREIAGALDRAGITAKAVADAEAAGERRRSSHDVIQEAMGTRSLGRQAMRAINRLFAANVVTDIDASGQHWIGGIFLTPKGEKTVKLPIPPIITSVQRRILEPYDVGGERLISAMQVWSNGNARLRVIPMIAKLCELKLLERKGRATFSDVDITTLGKLAVLRRSRR